MSAGGRRNRGSECVARRFRSQTAGRRQMRAENSLLPRLGDWAFCGATGPTAKHAYIYTYVMNFYLMGPLPSRALGRRTRRPGPEPGLFLAPPPPKRCRACHAAGEHPSRVVGSDSRHRHNQVRVQLITQAYKKEPAIPQNNTAEEVTSRLSLPIIPFVPIPRKTTAMGSAFSSNAKGLSLRRIASAAAIVCVALLLVITGGVATLHLRENTPPVRGGVLVQDRGTTMRRVPRKMLLAEAVE